jgi:hypothetical protein
MKPATAHDSSIVTGDADVATIDALPSDRHTVKAEAADRLVPHRRANQLASARADDSGQLPG